MVSNECPTQLRGIEQARRWAACVDFASPISAWTPKMMQALKEANGDKALAANLLLQGGKGKQAPTLPLVLKTSLTHIDLNTPPHEALMVNSELEALYSAYFGHSDWTWNDVHDLDREAFIELEQISSGIKDPNLIASFTEGWRKTYQKPA